MIDPRAALAAAAAELEAGEVSRETARRVLAALNIRPGKHDARLHDRDAAVCELAQRAAGSRTQQARMVAEWLRRWYAGDPLHDQVPDVARLAAEVEGPLSWRQVFRILGGDRSG